VLPVRLGRGASPDQGLDLRGVICFQGCRGWELGTASIDMMPARDAKEIVGGLGIMEHWAFRRQAKEH
jgi:hypothetical protein